MRRTSRPDVPPRRILMFSAAFLERANISEINTMSAEIPEIVAHNDESSKAT